MRILYFLVMGAIVGIFSCISVKAAQAPLLKYEKEFLELTPKQLERAKDIYIRAKPYGLDFAATALSIAWQESNLGEYPLNIQDPSCSMWHIQINYYLKRKNIKNTAFNKNKHCSILIADNDLAFEAFLEVYRLWEEVHKKKKMKTEFIIRSYNVGYNVYSNAAIRYSNAINARKKVINKYFKTDALEIALNEVE